MAHEKHVKKPWYLKRSLDDYFVDDRAATVDRDPEANFVPGVVQYSDDEYKVLQLPPNLRGRPEHVSEGKNTRVSQRQAAKKATERTTMLFEEYGQIVDEDEASSEEESRVTRQGPEKEAEEFVATIGPREPAKTYSRPQGLGSMTMTRQETSSSISGSGGRKRRAKTNIVATRKSSLRRRVLDRQDLADDREATLGREIVGTAESDIAKVGKVEEVIHVAVAPVTQAAPASEAPSQPAPLRAPGLVQSQTGVTEEHDDEESRHDKKNIPGSSMESRRISVDSRISSISLQWAQREEIIIHERFVNAAYLTIAGLRSSIVDDLARELGIINYADITDHLNEIRRNPHQGARVEAARALGKSVVGRKIVGGIKSE
ncbi:hypothetical protein CGCF415_v000752 [Colletotrichum fructicola]|uniref:Uncharacterized protein n=1 Tax=Colletotrichum fructicola (strain Nara gc5) TaxID=1213859 RepID=L2G5D0_COLFN|nr:uncharacterized protein CGMCC3_g14351 [Colletotrichum fructicola]KAF4487264.1 hypothetical protein CGGC5_v005685 [Colletotrichum fructicola Nara gc5]KAE9569567.1 hypothetical protein CGMCC3_g14351 [Colletotrichum fructicola]KAF4423856.1 hypothetical protein CFRS1_v006892 [Colletotrichum fructicola]KAF4889742.1 hypothetical protein CGCFRS4_v009138 [Colletotrichum fructicola]KAF4916563.1 hypothetical protein CGCF415_v000752 [Colletotrichum fructicola]